MKLQAMLSPNVHCEHHDHTFASIHILWRSYNACTDAFPGTHESDLKYRDSANLGLTFDSLLGGPRCFSLDDVRGFTAGAFGHCLKCFSSSSAPFESARSSL